MVLGKVKNLVNQSENYNKMIPSKFFLTKGIGFHKNRLKAFELAMRNAGLAVYNLVLVSSILPPNCKRISKEKGLKLLGPGEIVFLVMSKNETNEPNRLISASVGCAIPANKDTYGYLAEYRSFDETKEKVENHAENLAVSMLASSLGIKFNPKESQGVGRRAFKISGKIVYTTNITQTARGKQNGLWTSVVAAVVFIS